jgi:hypothetical protein
MKSHWQKEIELGLISFGNFVEGSEQKAKQRKKRAPVC